jgi:hypothetical protein
MANVNEDDMLKTEIQTLYSIHLGLAVDEMNEADELMKNPNESHNSLRARRLTISSILHAFCAIDSLVNYLGYNRFFYPDSEDYVPPDDREYLLNRQIQSWIKIKLTDRINLLFLSYRNDILDDNLEARISELNKLRNWIAHGKTYHTVSLIEPMESLPPGQGYYIIDEEIIIKEKIKFSHCKFKALHLLDHEDAKIALRIVGETFQILSMLSEHHLFFETYYPTVGINGMNGDLSANIDDILRIQ